MKRLFSIRTKGFSLVETLVAVALLSMTVIAPLTIASSGLASAYYAKDRLTAITLAQDALEFIRSYRDSNRILYNTPWLDGLDVCKLSAAQPLWQGCVVDTAAENPNRVLLRIVGGANSGPIKYDPATGLFGYKSSWQDSKFTRQVILTELIMGREARIDVTVSWKTSPLKTKTITISENITNW